MRKSSRTGKVSFVHLTTDIEKPWQTIQITAGYPVCASIKNAEKLTGAIKFKLHGDVPLSLTILISELHTAVT